MSPTPTVSAHNGLVGLPDRRLNRRYPITLEVEYKLLDGSSVQRQGFCRTVNISSRGVLLDLRGTLPILSTIELSINWPILLRGSIPLKLIMWGSIVRVEDNSIAVDVSEHEFRTAGHYQLKKCS